MEISEYATNVLSSSEFSTIHYLQLCPKASFDSSGVVGRSESSWRRNGALVTHVTGEQELWLFGTAEIVESFCSEHHREDDDDMTAHVDGVSWDVLARSSFEPSLLFKTLKPGMSSSSTATPTAQKSDASRYAQVQNSRAVHTNSSQSSTTSKDLADPSNSTKASEVVATSKPLVELFISAVLSSLMVHMASSSGMLPMNARTLVKLPSSVSVLELDGRTGSSIEFNKPIVVSLDVQMTAQCSLLLKATCRPAYALGCLTTTGANASLLGAQLARSIVYLAPIGRTAQVVSVDFAEVGSAIKKDSLPQTPTACSPNTNLVTRWKPSCISWLQHRGFDADFLRACPWVHVRLPSSTQNTDSDSPIEDTWFTVQWPAPLCFFNKPTNRRSTQQPTIFDAYDPLVFAESWLSEQVERDSIAKKRAKERDQVEAIGKAQADASNQTVRNGGSSQALRRGSLAGAMYPTPPDAIQQLVGAISSDTNDVTPGPTQDTTLDEVPENIESTKIEGEEGETQPWDSGEDRKDLASSNLEFHDQSTDNLFEEMDGDLFGENDITDADFSFFDEPDGPTPHKEVTTSFQRPAVDIPENDEITEPATIDEISIRDSKIDGDIDSVDGLDSQSEISTKIMAPPVIFTSNEPDNAPEIDIFTNKIVDPPPRAISPPLNPELVFKRLSVLGLGSEKIREVKNSAFGGLEFNPSLPSFTSKYGNRGRFNSPIVSKSMLRSPSIALPKTEYMNKRRKRHPHVVDHLTPSSSGIASPRSSRKLRRSSQSEYDSEVSSHASAESDQDDTSDTSTEGPTTSTTSLKRKRGGAQSASGEPSRHPLQAMQVDGTERAVTDATEALGDQTILDMDPAEWALDRYFRLLKPDGYMVPFEDAEYVAIAQTLADQAMSNNFRIEGLAENDAEDLFATVDQQRVQMALSNDLMNAAECFLGHVTKCTLTSFLEVQDGANVGQHRVPPRPMNTAARATALHEPPRPTFSLAAPQLEVSRADSRLTIMPSAVAFWENLGLGPAKGAKDVCAVCIHPRGQEFYDNVKAFLDHVGSAYESSHLGSHERFSTDEFAYDLTPASSLDPLSLQSDDQLTAPTFPSFQQINVRLGSLLTAANLSEKNFVIYYAYNPATPEVLVHICSAFHNLFELYKASFAAAKTPVTNDLVLQLVPLDFVASTTAMVVPTPAEYANLAMEVYDRCVDLKTGIACPAIILERPLPRLIDFKVNATPSASLMHENSAIHVAYAQSIDDRWMTAAWTDNSGATQCTAAYCLGRKRPIFAFSAVAAEIWDTTLGIISSRKVHWRIMIARCGVMEPHEVEFWRSLASIESNPQISMTLVTVNTKPSLQLIPPSETMPPSNLAAQSTLLTTPVATPQPNTLSPEQSGNAATPARDGGPAMTPTENSEVVIGPDAILTDLRDQSWGAILSHRLNNSHSLLDLNPALVSGYLIKRGGTLATDSPVVMEVSIVHCEVNPRLYEAYLKDILAVYRGLGTLARVRGRVDSAKDVRPWHVAAAEKAADLLYMLM